MPTPVLVYKFKFIVWQFVLLIVSVPDVYGVEVNPLPTYVPLYCALKQVGVVVGETLEVEVLSFFLQLESKTVQDITVEMYRRVECFMK
jgi:hypothetical protein